MEVNMQEELRKCNFCLQGMTSEVNYNIFPKYFDFVGGKVYAELFLRDIYKNVRMMLWSDFYQNIR